MGLSEARQSIPRFSLVLGWALAATGAQAITISPDETITQTYYWPGPSAPISHASPPGQLDFTVDGRINSITVVPLLTILETGQHLVLPFGFAPDFLPNAANPPQWSTAQPNGIPMTIVNHSDDPPNVVSDSLHLTFGDDFGDSLIFHNMFSYESQHGNLGANFQLSLELTSVDYTPPGTGGGGVPDASNTASLLAVGMVGVFWAARRIQRRAPTPARS